MNPTKTPIPRRSNSTELVMLLVAAACAAPVDAGSLYRPDNYRALTSDTRSYRIGDALTVLIVESSNAQSEADSTASRDLSLQGTAHNTRHQYTAGAEVKRNATGKGVTNRNGSLNAQISVRVRDVAANGDLAVYGTQKITINGEVQTIAVKGVVRPIDVTADNAVLSTRLTNAEIAYTGRGFVDRNQRESWISRLLGWLGL